MDRENVIEGMECCLSNKYPPCSKCGYDGDIRYNDAWSCRLSLMADALALLKAQEPRVLTLEEVAAWHSIPESKRDPIYVEYQPNSGLGVPHWTIEYFGFNPNSYPNKDSGYYGKWLRCWTSRPTEEQREAVKWDV